MAENDVFIEAPPERVFAVLAEPARYPEWVVGAREVRAAEERFPEPGASFAWEGGAGPFTLSDETTVVESEPPRRLVLEVRVSRLGTARIELTLEREAAGTRVTMVEAAERGAVLRAANAVADGILSLRNDRALERLKRLAEA